MGFLLELSLDTKKNAKTFIDIVNPSITFFVKYDFWANYLNELQSKNLKHYVIAAIFRENQYFFQKRKSFLTKKAQLVLRTSRH